jgi:hypothetical protein
MKMSILSNLMLTFLSILCVSSFNPRQLENDIKCNVKGGILCTKDELMIIATIAQGIVRAATEIEKKVKIEFLKKKTIDLNCFSRLNKQQKFRKHLIDVLA